MSTHSRPPSTSSRSTRTVDDPHLNSRFRTWRTLSFSSNTTGLSKVHAEPEHGAPLARAADRLGLGRPRERRGSRASLREREYNPADLKRGTASPSMASAELPPTEEERERGAAAAAAQQPNTAANSNGYSNPYSQYSTNDACAREPPVPCLAQDDREVYVPHQTREPLPTAGSSSGAENAAEPPQTQSHSTSTVAFPTSRAPPAKSHTWFASFGRAKGRATAREIRLSAPHEPEPEPVASTSALSPPQEPALSPVEPAANRAQAPGAAHTDSRPYKMEEYQAHSLEPSANQDEAQAQAAISRSWLPFGRKGPPPPRPSTADSSQEQPTASTSTLTLQPTATADDPPNPLSPPSTSTSTSTATVTAPLPEPGPGPARSPPQPINTAAANGGTGRRGWFFSTSPGAALASPSPLSASFPSAVTSASTSALTSLDDEVPQLDLLHVHPPDAGSGPGISMTTSAPALVEPSSSGDSEATVQVQAEQGTVRGRKDSLNPSTSRFRLRLPLLGRPKMPLDAAMQAQGGEERDAKTGQPASAAVESLQHASVEHAPQASTSTWWGYVGWGGEENTSGAVDTSPDPGHTATLGAPQAESTQSNPPAAASESHASSSWLSPRAWYAAKPQLPPVGEEGGKTESEEEALARDGTPPEANPIESSVSAYRASWAYLFSSRSALGQRRIEDEHGVEIMTVPPAEGGDGDAASVQSKDGQQQLVPSKRPAPAKDKDRPASPAPSAPPASRSTSPSPSPSPQKRTRTVNAPTLVISEEVKEKAARRKPSNPARAASVKSTSTTTGTGAGTGGAKTPPRPPPPPPNLVLPTWDDTFHSPPRNAIPGGDASRLMKFVSGVLFDQKGKERGAEDARFGRALPRAFDAEGRGRAGGEWDVLRGCRRVVVIGIHGWFPGAVMRSVLGEPTGTSVKFASMMVQALEEFQEEHGCRLDKITSIPLEGEGTIEHRVTKLYASLQANEGWMADLHGADAVLVATHSQGSVVATHLLDRLIRDQHIRTHRSVDAEAFASGGSVIRRAQRVCCLALCGIHLGPLRYLSSSSLLQPYIQYFESKAATELFEFQNTESEVSKAYVSALEHVVEHGTKMVYVASLNDQVVPIYSGLFTSADHPLILRALYIDGDAYTSSDFLSNLLVLLLRVRNTGLSDSGLLAHLSEATAGSLNGVGHSTAYEELATFSLAVKYLFLTDDGHERHPPLSVEPFNASQEQNDYEIPWSLRDLIANPHVAHLFAREILGLRDAFREWQPKTTILRDVKRKLQPIQKLPSTITGVSKL